MEDENPRPLQRPRIEQPESDPQRLARMQLEAEARRVESINRQAAPAQAPAVERAPFDIERDRAFSRISQQFSGQNSGTPTGEARYDNCRNRGGGNEFRSFHAEMNAHIASREPGGENTGRIGAGDRFLAVQTGGQSSREGLDHSGQVGRPPASLLHDDMGRSNLDNRRRDERRRNPIEID